MSDPETSTPQVKLVSPPAGKSLGAMVALALFLVFYLVDLGVVVFSASFKRAFDDMNVEVPPIAAAVLDAADLLARPSVLAWFVALAVPVASTIAFARGARGRRATIVFGLAAGLAFIVLAALPLAVLVPIFQLQGSLQGR
jgi:hypothetical protein